MSPPRTKDIATRYPQIQRGVRTGWGGPEQIPRAVHHERGRVQEWLFDQRGLDRPQARCLWAIGPDLASRGALDDHQPIETGSPNRMWVRKVKWLVDHAPRIAPRCIAGLFGQADTAPPDDRVPVLEQQLCRHRIRPEGAEIERIRNKSAEVQTEPGTSEQVSIAVGTERQVEEARALQVGNAPRRRGAVRSRPNRSSLGGALSALGPIFEPQLEPGPGHGDRR